MRTIGVVTVGRSDYGIYLPLLKRLQADPEVRLHLIVAGMHLSSEFGLTAATIEADGFEIGQRVEMLVSSDTPEGISKSMGLGTIGFSQAYASFPLDLLVVLGDRFEMHAAVVAALPFLIPVAHISGGELTRGAMDDALRHSITKLSHLHFVSTQEYARRVQQLGEEPWRIIISGALGLDNLPLTQLLTPVELEHRYQFQLQPAPLLVTFHPVTLEYDQTEWQVGQLLSALDECRMPVIFTRPNADTRGRVVSEMMESFVQTRDTAYMVGDLGTQAYFSVMSSAVAMVGNSSSGITEAAPFGLPVVNIGTRQEGRVRTANIIDVGYPAEEILIGIRQAVSMEFRAEVSNISSPYGDGHAVDRIIPVLKEMELNDHLLIKRFVDCAIRHEMPPIFAAEQCSSLASA